MRLVVDTNIMISALGWKGPEYILMKRIFMGKAELFFSAEILSEFQKVAQRPGFGFARDDIEEFTVALLETGILKVPQKKVKVDPPDNMFLECTSEAKADFLVSGDDHLLKLSEFEGTKILRARKVLEYVPE